jgi:hypothetical protein
MLKSVFLLLVSFLRELPLTLSALVALLVAVASRGPNVAFAHLLLVESLAVVRLSLFAVKLDLLSARARVVHGLIPVLLTTLLTFAKSPKSLIASTLVL